MLALYAINLAMRLITTQQFANLNTNITIKKQATRIKNHNVIANNLKKAKKIASDNNSNCANQFNIFFEACALYLLR